MHIINGIHIKQVIMDLYQHTWYNLIYYKLNYTNYDNKNHFITLLVSKNYLPPNTGATPLPLQSSASKADHAALILSAEPIPLSNLSSAYSLSSVVPNSSSMGLEAPLRQGSNSSPATIKFQLSGYIADGLASVSRLKLGQGSGDQILAELERDTDLMDKTVTDFLEVEKGKASRVPQGSATSAPYYALVHELRTPLQNQIGLFDIPKDKRPENFLTNYIVVTKNSMN